MSRLKIYLDLDGVFADFYRQVESELGPNWQKLPDDKLWQELEKIPHFFNTLKVLPHSLKLVTFLMYHDLEILTAIPRPTGNLATAAADKREWVARNISPRIKVNTVLGGKNKANYVIDEHTILIDDFERNIKVWRKRGGCGILHTSVEDTLDQLDALGVL